MDLIKTINDFGASKPNDIAHIVGNSNITYGELINKSNSLAVYLIQKFGEDKTPIIVYGHKQHEMIICFLACVKAGHAYIPIDSNLPYERISDIIEGSKAKFLFEIEHNEHSFQGIENVNIDEINSIISEYPDTIPSSEYAVKSDETYYIIYTSGSTGKPKGVQITLSCLTSFVKWVQDICNIQEDEDSVFMNQAPFSFDLSVMDLYLSLTTGSTLISITKHMTESLKDLFDCFKKSNINIWVSTPSFAEMCLADKSFNKELLPDLKLFLFCGETLSNNCAEKLLIRFPESRVVNTYGPTESTVAITSVEVNNDIVKNINPLPVGYPKENCKVFIIDKEGNELQEEERGEILIVGDSVSTGYYRNPVITEKSFSVKKVDDYEFRSYKTGDEGYIRDGMLYYCGRIDFQIKLNGYRIELEDIESNLKKISFVENAIVIPKVKEGSIQYLTAVVVLNKLIEEKEFQIALMIKSELKKFLPEYMIPRKIIVRDAFPMTNNGKIDRKQLMGEIK